MSKAESLLAAQGWRGRGLDFALGAIAVLGLAPFHIWPLAILCFGGLALRFGRRAQDSQRAAKLCRSSGLWFGLGYFLFGLFWIGAAFIARGPSYIPLMIPGVVLLCAVLSLFWALAGHFYAKLRPSGLWAPFIFASLMSMAEIARGHVFSGFPWNLPGYIFKAGGVVSQSASLIGIYGLTFLTFLLAATAAHCLLPSRKDGNSAFERSTGAVCLITLFGLFGFGILRLSMAADIEFHDGVNLRIVQTPFNQKANMDPGGSVAIVNDYLTQTSADGLEDITHVIWPEGSTNGVALENQALVRAVSDLFLSFDDTPPVWLASSLRQELKRSGGGQAYEAYYNTSSAVTFGADGSAAIAAINDKHKLVPFGEGLPGGRFLEPLGISPMSTAQSFIVAADEKELSTFPGLPKLSPQICYEIIFPGFTPRETGDSDAQWILNQSNDGWYGQSTGPLQHANQAAYRAIEEGLPIVRAAANGISGIIDPYGRWLKSAAPKAQTAIDTPLPKAIRNPLFSVNLIWLLFLINLSICLGYVLRMSKQYGTD